MTNFRPPPNSPFAWLARARRSLATFLRPPQPVQPRVLVVVEGPNDIEFLRRISAILHRDDPRMPDLADMERRACSSLHRPAALTYRPLSASLGCPAGVPSSRSRCSARHADPTSSGSDGQLTARCHAAVTSKRSLENYLHPAAILEASGFSVAYSDDEDVPELVAQRVNERHESGVRWEDLPARARKRLRFKAKRWLNSRAVEQMTPARLAARDGGGEVRAWLATIAELGGR